MGDKVLVKFPKIPRGVNPNFFKKWRGGFIVKKKVGELNLVVRASPHSKPILVHVNRVKAQTVNDRLVSFNLKFGADLPFSSPQSDDEDGPVLHYSVEPDFGAYIESASDSEEDKEEASGEKEATAVGQARGEPAPAELTAYPDQPARVTCGQARELGIFVPDVGLPDRCWSSSRYRP